MSSGASGPSQLSKYFLRSLSTNSNTKYSLPSLCTTSLSLYVHMQEGRDSINNLHLITTAGIVGLSYSTILGCFSCLRTEISLSVVLGMPSSSTSNRILCRSNDTIHFIHHVLDNNWHICLP